MTSVPKEQTKRPAAGASTGPRTAAGKARAARNARRHGLAVPVLRDPALSAEVEVLVREIVGKVAGPKMIELARPVAEAQIDLKRVRRAREDLIAAALDDPNYRTRRAFKDSAKLGLVLARRPGDEFTADEFIQVLSPAPVRENKYVVILCDLAKRLAALERYERRALSRRKFAIRAFDAAGFTWAPANRRVGKPSSTTKKSGRRCNSPAPPEPPEPSGTSL